MASVYRKTITKPLPASAEIFSREGSQFARWKDRRNKSHTAAVIKGRDGSMRIAIKAKTYTAKYRDGQGILREVSTRCRSKEGARAVLKELLDRAEKVRSGILSPAEDAIIDHLDTPLASHIEAYLEDHRSRGSSTSHLEGVEIRLNRLCRELSLVRLGDLRPETMAKWLAARSQEGIAARTRNSYLEVWKAFCNWCADTNRLASNPLAKLRKVNQKADLRHIRRSMTVEDLQKLLYVARWRPLAELGRETIKLKPSEKGHKRSSWTYLDISFSELSAAVARARARAKDKPQLILEREHLGHERCLIYKMLALTGLRRNELASLTVGDLRLDAAVAHILLPAALEKSRQGAELPLRDDLVSDIRDWLAEKARVRQVLAGDTSQGNLLESDTSLGVSLDEKLFRVPRQLVKVLDRDLRVAGIAKVDDRGHKLDIHALRHSFASLLSAAGVAPRTAQAAMRHSDVNLTMSVYTDPRVLDVRAALDALPSLPLGDALDSEHHQPHDPGVAGEDEYAPKFAPNSEKPCKLGTITDKTSDAGDMHSAKENPVKQSVSRGSAEHARKDSNLQPLVPKTSALSN